MNIPFHSVVIQTETMYTETLKFHHFGEFFYHKLPMKLSSLMALSDCSWQNMDATLSRKVKWQNKITIKYNLLCPFHKHVFTFIPAWMNLHMPSKGWGEIIYQLSNFNGYTIEAW